MSTPETYVDECESMQQRRADIADSLSVAALTQICLVAIGLGIYVSVHATNEGIPVLAAIACAVVINVLLGPKGE